MRQRALVSMTPEGIVASEQGEASSFRRTQGKIVLMQGWLNSNMYFISLLEYILDSPLPQYVGD